MKPRLRVENVLGDWGAHPFDEKSSREMIFLARSLVVALKAAGGKPSRNERFGYPRLPLSRPRKIPESVQQNTIPDVGGALVHVSDDERDGEGASH